MKEMVVLITGETLGIRTFERDLDDIDATLATDLAEVPNAIMAQAVVNRVKAQNKRSMKLYHWGDFTVGAGNGSDDTLDIAALVEDILADVVYVKNLARDTVDVYTSFTTEPLPCGAVIAIEGRSFSIFHAPFTTIGKILGVQ